MPESFLEAGKQGFIVTCLHVDHAVGVQACLSDCRREQILPRHEPKHLALRPCRDSCCKKRCCCSIVAPLPPATSWRAPKARPPPGKWRSRSPTPKAAPIDRGPCRPQDNECAPEALPEMQEGQDRSMKSRYAAEGNAASRCPPRSEMRTCCVAEGSGSRTNPGGLDALWGLSEPRHTVGGRACGSSGGGKTMNGFITWFLRTPTTFPVSRGHFAISR